MMSGTRPLLVELQALLADSSGPGAARRASFGVDPARVALLSAVLEKKEGLVLSDKDVFVNAAGGAELNEPAGDLALLAALCSSIRDEPIDGRTLVLGEVGSRRRGRAPSRHHRAADRRGGAARVQALHPPSGEREAALLGAARALPCRERQRGDRSPLCALTQDELCTDWMLTWLGQSGCAARCPAETGRQHPLRSAVSGQIADYLRPPEGTCLVGVQNSASPADLGDGDPAPMSDREQPEEPTTRSELRKPRRAGDGRGRVGRAVQRTQQRRFQRARAGRHGRADALRERAAVPRRDRGGPLGGRHFPSLRARGAGRQASRGRAS